MNTRICAVIVTYQAKRPVGEMLPVLLEQVERVCIVGNGSDGSAQASLTQAAEAFPGRIHLLLNPENLGLARAQNQGIRFALDEGFDWVLLLDDDSTPEAHMVQNMLVAWERQNDPRIGIVAPRLVEQNTSVPARYPVLWGGACVRRRTVHAGEQLPGVLTVIASGSLIRSEVFRDIGLMAEEFFIDYVDHEFCLRARQHDYTIMVAGDAVLRHRQGHKSRRQILGITVVTANYDPSRRYYIFRNRMFVLRRYGGCFPFLWPYEIMAYAWDLARMAVLEKEPLSKLRAAWRGFCEGVTRPLP